MKQLYETVIGKSNRDYYQKKFEKFDTKGKGLKVSWNWPALFFTGIWALYRKMYGWFFLFWIIAFISHIFEEIGQPELSAVTIGLPAILFAIFSNSLYQKKLTKKIIKAQNKFGDEDRQIEYLHRKGGVNKWVLWVFIILPVLGVVAAIVTPLVINDSGNKSNTEQSENSLSRSSDVAAICIDPSLSDKDNFSNCLSEAKNGKSDAQEIIGDMYYSGDGVLQNHANTVKWLKKSAEQDNASAQFKLGLMYFDGKGVKQDYKESFNWYLKSAKQGFSSAQLNLAYMYSNGFGMDQDYTQSAKWNKAAAEQGVTTAQARLGAMYIEGLGVVKDQEEGLKWFRQAAYKNTRHQKTLGNLYFFGEHIKQNYNEAFKWYLLAAQQGDSIAQKNIATLYVKGKGVPKDVRIASEWYKKSALQDNADANIV